MTITKRTCLDSLTEQCLGQLQPLNVYFVYYLYMPFEKINLLLKLKQFGCCRIIRQLTRRSVFWVIDPFLPKAFKWRQCKFIHCSQDINVRRRIGSCASVPQQRDIHTARERKPRATESALRSEHIQRSSDKTCKNKEGHVLFLQIAFRFPSF